MSVWPEVTCPGQRSQYWLHSWPVHSGYVKMTPLNSLLNLVPACQFSSFCTWPGVKCRGKSNARTLFPPQSSSPETLVGGSPMSEANSRTAHSILTYDISFESWRTGDGHTTSVILIWLCPRVKIKAQSWTIECVFEPYAPCKKKCRHEIPRTIFHYRIRF